MKVGDMVYVHDPAFEGGYAYVVDVNDDTSPECLKVMFLDPDVNDNEEASVWADECEVINESRRLG